MGKFTFNDLRELLHCINNRPEVIIPPKPGFDAGVHLIGDDACLVIATDPCIGVPEQWFGWLAINYSASDVALFGAKPQFCTLNLLGPLDTELAVFKRIMRQACNAALQLDMSIITGHTGTYAGLTTVIATCTSYGIVKRSKLITPAGAQPGDCILITKSLGLETLTNFVLVNKALAQKLFGLKQVRTLSNQISMQTCVEEALLLADTGVSAMHDVTEGGLVAALNEVADASDVGFILDFEKILMTPQLHSLMTHFNCTQSQILSISSTGSIIAGVSPENTNKIVKTLNDVGINVSIVGQFTKNKDRLLTYMNKTENFPKKIDDPYDRILGN